VVYVLALTSAVVYGAADIACALVAVVLIVST